MKKRPDFEKIEQFYRDEKKKVARELIAKEKLTPKLTNNQWYAVFNWNSVRLGDDSFEVEQGWFELKIKLLGSSSIYWSRIYGSLSPESVVFYQLGEIDFFQIEWLEIFITDEFFDKDMIFDFLNYLRDKGVPFEANETVVLIRGYDNK